MKSFIVYFLLILNSSVVFSQTATDFTANDCNGNSHNLFSELNAGKVIVLCWVMPCGACTGPASTSYNIVQSYQATNPNTVYFYMADDYANSACQVVNSWGNSNGIPENAWSIRFSNSTIDMTDYGATGMPKIVVLGGANHTVFYNANNTVNSANLQNAINTALSTTGINESHSIVSDFTVSPNPSNNVTEINFNLLDKSNVKIELYNLEGKLMKNVFEGMVSSGENKIQLDVSGYSAGVYLLNLSAGNKSKSINLVVSK